MQIQEIMTSDVIVVRATTPVEEIARLFNRHRIGGAPVVDDKRRLLGIVTERDLFLKEKGMPFSAVKVPVMFKQWVKPETLDEIYELARQHTAADVMTREVLSVQADEPVRRAAWLIVRAGLKRIPVLRADRLAGIVTRTDLVRTLTEE